MHTEKDGWYPLHAEKDFLLLQPVQQEGKWEVGKKSSNWNGRKTSITAARATIASAASRKHF
jgi:hypothetical protein